MRSRPSIIAAAAAILLSASAAPLAAQGSLSTQGFGYPPGQVSTRAAGAGGGVAEVDPLSPVNPAALINWGGSAVFFQTEPEFRTVTANSQETRTTTWRYPLVMGALSLGPRAIVALSSSTLLDRTWTTTEEGDIDVEGTPTAAVTTYRSEGAINDIRLAGAYAPRPWLRVGLGAHAFTGRNLLTLRSEFLDSLAFTPLQSVTSISYGGNAVSAGVEARFARNFSIAASGRIGGSITAERNDTTLSRGKVPRRFGVGVAYLGIRGGTIGMRASHEGWSSLSSLGAAGFTAHDSWDLGAGADVPGPRFGRNVLQLRAGVRRRTLPFEAAGERVNESSFSFGTGTAFANGRVFGDLGVTRASRSVPSGAADERAWTLSLGLAVRP